MLASPISRNRRSDSRASCAAAPRQRRGQRKGRMPSRTSSRQNAMPNSCHMIPTDAKKPGFSRLPHDTTFSSTVTPADGSRPPGRGSRLGLFQVAEEIAARIKHQHITLIREALAISPQAAIERVELLILTIRPGVDGRSLGIAITAQLFSLAIGIGQQHATLTVGIGANTFGQLLTLGPMLASLTLTLGAHAVEHAAVDLFRQVDGLDPHIHHLDTQLTLRSTAQPSRNIPPHPITPPPSPPPPPPPTPTPRPPPGSSNPEPPPTSPSRPRDPAWCGVRLPVLRNV